MHFFNKRGVGSLHKEICEMPGKIMNSLFEFNKYNKTKIWITKIGRAFCASYLISKALYKCLSTLDVPVTLTARQHPTESQSTCHINRPDMILPSHLGNNALLMPP
ncbi:hypothetical protein ILYODFUR_023330 [Ilyodon furcidens]|uniref:Uncharacterized protein n=1 Tax=Ilyodon furcidens TaxID=33524 RepID=A0ABV0V835_9TELE